LPTAQFRAMSKFQEEYFLSFSHDGIVFKTASINSVLKWDIYSELLESDDFFYIVQNSKLYTLIPKRVFTGSEEDDFRQLAVGVLKKLSRI
jgi:hypothetical protein